MSTVTDPILIVEDEASIRQGIAEALEAAGYPVLTVENGRQALSTLETVTPRLVVLDLRLPDLDGWAFAQSAKDRGYHLTIIVVSATPRDVSSMINVGVVTWLEKPFHLDELLVRVNALAGPPPQI